MSLLSRSNPLNVIYRQWSEGEWFRPSSAGCLPRTGVILGLLLWSATLAWTQQGGVRAHGGEPTKGYLGIEFHDAPQGAFGFFHLRSSHEVEVLMVDHDGPAGKAGLIPHDLILGLNGQAVSGSESLKQMIHDARAGSMITLSVLRDGQPLTLIAQLEIREDVEKRAWERVTVPPGGADDSSPNENRVSPNAEAAPPGRGKRFLGEVLHTSTIGVHLTAMSPQLSIYFGAPASCGLLVESVTAGSPAALSGLQAGDVILRADSVTLHSLSDWSKRLHASKGRGLGLVVLRERHEVPLTLQPDAGRSSVEWTLQLQGASLPVLHS